VKRIIFSFPSAATLGLALATLAGCASQVDPSVATIDLTRIQNNWPKFINYSNQLASDTASINRSGASPREKEQQLDALRRRYVSMQNEVSGDVRDAAEKVATDRHIKLVVTRQFVGYGGIDITPDVEKILQITEASPKS
jgi:Skp family chaperone for outer membrane proteins